MAPLIPKPVPSLLPQLVNQSKVHRGSVWLAWGLGNWAEAGAGRRGSRLNQHVVAEWKVQQSRLANIWPQVQARKAAVLQPQLRKVQQGEQGRMGQGVTQIATVNACGQGAWQEEVPYLLLTSNVCFKFGARQLQTATPLGTLGLPD